ncbi:MAG: head-tail connector protein, partial [Treponema sp.]|nr:head-tail connector protein [Treponema sp.]
EKLLYAEYSRSNLYRELPKVIENAVTFGHGVLLVDEDLAQNRIRAGSMDVSEVYLDKNEYGDVDTVYRAFTMTVKQAAAFFGEEKLHEKVREDFKDPKRWRNEIEVIHAVYPRSGREEHKPDAKNKAYASVFMDKTHEHLIEESGYDDFPYAVFIWDAKPGSAYGIGPAVKALDDVRLLNVAEEERIRLAQLSARPPMMVPNKMQGQEQIVPEGHNYYYDADKLIFPINVGANFPITIEITQSIEERIRDWFHVDFFLMLQHQDRQMTATEVLQLQGEKAAVLGNMVANLNAALRKIVQRSYDILLKQGKLPEPPEALRETQAALKVDFAGVLAQAQKQAHQYQGIAAGIQLMGAIAQFAQAVPAAQEAFDAVDFDRLVKTGFEGNGVPQNIIREDEDIAAIRQIRAQAQAQAAQQAEALEQQKNLLGNYNKLNEPVKPGSALARAGM